MQLQSDGSVALTGRRLSARRQVCVHMQACSTCAWVGSANGPSLQPQPNRKNLYLAAVGYLWASTFCSKSTLYGTPCIPIGNAMDPMGVTVRYDDGNKGREGANRLAGGHVLRESDEARRTQWSQYLTDRCPRGPKVESGYGRPLPGEWVSEQRNSVLGHSSGVPCCFPWATRA